MLADMTVGLVANLKTSPWTTTDSGAAEHSQHLSTDDILVAAQLGEDNEIRFTPLSYKRKPLHMKSAESLIYYIFTWIMFYGAV